MDTVFDPLILELLSSSIDPIFYLSGHLYKENIINNKLENFSESEKIFFLDNNLNSVSVTPNEDYKKDILNDPFKQGVYFANLFESIKTKIDSTKTFTYLQFNSLELLNEKESTNSSVGLTAEVKPFYNYYSKNYEEFLLKITGAALPLDGVYETSLPNFYSLNNCLINSASSNDLYQISLNGDINLNILKTDVNQYFEYYADGNRPIDFYEKNLKYKTIILPDINDQFYNSLKLEKSDVPFGVEISFDGFEQNEFTNFLVQDGYYCTVAKNIDALSNFNYQSNFYQNKTIFDLIENVNEDGTTSTSLSVSNSYTSSSLQNYLYIATGSLTSVISFNTSSATLQDFDPINQYSVQFVNCEQPTDFSSILDFYLSKAKIETELEKLKINYSDIINNNINSAKPILFVVEKYRNNNLIQKFYVPNIGRNNFIDSQVNFGVEYTYVINSYSLVGNLEYSYNGFANTAFDFLSPIESEITETKSLKLVKNEIFTKNVVVYDNPPLAPDAQVFPVINQSSNNLIQLFLNAPIGQNYEVPIFINGILDKALLQKSITSQEVLDGQQMLFSTDDPPYGFFVHRKQIVPTSYEDFSNSTTTLVLADTNSYSKNVIDSLQFNTKYYYCFRTLDIHRQISNPSPVYEIEIVEDKGNFYPVVRPFQLQQKTDSFNSVTFKKYLHITPSPTQISINTEQSGLVGSSTAFDKNIVLGPNENSLWGKKFKIRLKSKTSGKIVDFNLTFEQNHIVTEDEKNRVIT